MSSFKKWPLDKRGEEALTHFLDHNEREWARETIEELQKLSDKLGEEITKFRKKLKEVSEAKKGE